MSSYTIKLLAPALLFTASLPLSSNAKEGNAPPPLTREQCLTELDSAVSLLTNETRRNLAAVAAAGSIAATIDKIVVDSTLAKLEQQCPDMPQLAHNRGVLAASAERWPEAVAHLQRSLNQDKRAAETYQLLQQIYEHLASLAYSRALETPIETDLPTLKWQNSGDQNTDQWPSSKLLEELQTPTTLEYELFAWWNALQNSKGLAEHYVDDFPSDAIEQARQRYANQSWDDINRDISFASRDAVVLLTDAQGNHSMLMLRLVGTRWKIYREKSL